MKSHLFLAPNDQCTTVRRHSETAWWCHFHPWHCLQNGGSFFMIVLRWASLGAKFARLVSSRRWNKSPKDISFKGGEKCQFKLGSWLMAPHLSQYLDRYSKSRQPSTLFSSSWTDEKLPNIGCIKKLLPLRWDEN